MCVKVPWDRAALFHCLLCLSFFFSRSCSHSLLLSLTHPYYMLREPVDYLIHSYPVQKQDKHVYHKTYFFCINSSLKLKKSCLDSVEFVKTIEEMKSRHHIFSSSSFCSGVARSDSKISAKALFGKQSKSKHVFTWSVFFNY